MSTTKLPFKKYTNLNNELVNQLGCSDAYRAFVLSLTTDKVNNTTDTTLDQLAGFIGEKVGAYKGNSKSKSFTQSLMDTKCVSIGSTKTVTSKGCITRNSYTFLKGETFRMIGVEFYNLDLDIKLKGYLLKLFSLCNVNTLFVGVSSNEIYKTSGVSKVSQKKYNTILEAKGLITITEEGIVLNVEGFKSVAKKQVLTPEVKEVLNNAKVIIKSHMKSLKMTSINSREDLERLKINGLDIVSFKLGVYMLKGFEGINDINKLVMTTAFGKKPKRNTPPTITL